MLGRFVCWCIALVVAACPNVSTARQAPRHALEHWRVVLTILGDASPEDTRAVLASIHDHLRTTNVVLTVATNTGAHATLRPQLAWARVLADQHDADAVLWLEMTSGDFLLYLVEPTQGRLMMRTVARNHASRIATFESLGIIVRSVVTALAAGQKIGMVPVDFERPEPRVVEPAASRAGWPRLRLTTGYAGNSFATSIPWQHGIEITADWRVRPPLYLGAGYRGVFPSRFRSDEVEIELQRNPINLHIGYHGDLKHDFAMELEVAGTVDLTTRRTIRHGPIITSVGRSIRPVPSASSWLRAHWYPVSNLSIYVAIGFEVMLYQFTYVLARPDGQSVLVAPHTLRAQVAAGFSYGFLTRERRVHKRKIRPKKN